MVAHEHLMEGAIDGAAARGEAFFFFFFFLNQSRTWCTRHANSCVPFASGLVLPNFVMQDPLYLFAAPSPASELKLLASAIPIPISSSFLFLSYLTCLEWRLELLKRASVCITHAGLNTVLESLTQGVPRQENRCGHLARQSSPLSISQHC